MCTVNVKPPLREPSTDASFQPQIRGRKPVDWFLAFMPLQSKGDQGTGDAVAADVCSKLDILPTIQANVE